jgi:hypothetical protein
LADPSPRTRPSWLRMTTGFENFGALAMALSPRS